MSERDFLVHSRPLPPDQAGELLHLPRQEAMWEWMSFFVRRLLPGDTYQASTDGAEAAVVLLGGTCVANWGQGEQYSGKRKHVIDGVPYTLDRTTSNTV